MGKGGSQWVLKVTDFLNGYNIVTEQRCFWCATEIVHRRESDSQEVMPMTPTLVTNAEKSKMMYLYNVHSYETIFDSVTR